MPPSTRRRPFRPHFVRCRERAHLLSRSLPSGDVCVQSRSDRLDPDRDHRTVGLVHRGETRYAGLAHGEHAYDANDRSDNFRDRR